MTQTENNNYNPLPWYDSVEKQDFRKWYAYGAVYPLFAPANILLPWQIIRDHRTNNITAVEMYDKKGTLIADITQPMLDAGLQIVQTDDYPNKDIIIYPANQYMATDMQNGQYFLRLTDGVQEWFSEVLTIVQDITPYLRIMWNDVENAVFDSGVIVYRDPIKYRNLLYFNASIGKPDYDFEETGENRDGYYFAEKQVSTKTYKFTILAPEYLCDCMRFIRLSDRVSVNAGGVDYNCDTFLITPKWEGAGALASVECEFTTQTVVKKIGQGYIKETHGDYNNDFNNDYNND